MSTDQIIVLGCGEADDSFQKQLKGHSGSVRFADPAAWATAGAVASAFSEARDRLNMISRDEIGLLTICSDGPREVIAQIAESAKSGWVSALRFSAVSPGSLTGLSCIVSGLRGPTLNLTLDPIEKNSLVSTLMRQWLFRRGVPAVSLVACAMGHHGRPVARCAIFSKGSSDIEARTLDEVLTWITSVSFIGTKGA